MVEAQVALEGVDHAAMTHGQDTPHASGVIDDVVEGGEHPSQEQFVGLPTGWPPPGVEGARELVFDLFSGQSRELAGIAFPPFGVNEPRSIG